MIGVIEEYLGTIMRTGQNSKGKKYGAKRIEWDHKHDREKVSDYEFESAGQLLDDFWKDVNRILSGA